MNEDEGNDISDVWILLIEAGVENVDGCIDAMLNTGRNADEIIADIDSDEIANIIADYSFKDNAI